MAAAIGWLVETISATLKIDKLDAWIRQVGLADDIEKLKSEIWGVETVVTAAKGRGFGSELLDERFALLEERLYEADDVVDELDYYRLQEQVQGLPAPADPSELLPLPGVTRGEPEDVLVAEQFNEISRGDADVPQRQSFGKRSVVWEHFTITERDNGKPVKAVCRHCDCSNEFKCDTKTNGTSSMKKHLENEHSVTCAKKPPGAHPANPSSTGEPTVIGSSSSRKGKRRRSKAWELFDVIEKVNEQPMKARCKYCPTEIKCGPTSGTAGMLNHNKICKNKPGPDDQSPNPPSTGDANADVTPILIGDSSTRKGRMDQSVQITAANTIAPWDIAELSNRIRKIASQLQYIQEELAGILKLHGSNSTSSSDHHQNTISDQHLGTSSLVPRNVYGRGKEKEHIMKLMMTEGRSEKVIVVPIVGIAGVGKTTLTQHVYGKEEVKRQFDHRIWVWVSHNFDKMRLTREMLSFVSRKRHEGVDSFVKLQEILRSRVKSKRVLLILDDVWDDKNEYQWNQLLAPFKANGANGNVILVTTRKLSVAKMIGTTEPVKLGALENDDFCLLFKSCALGDGNNDCDGNLSTIGKQIVKKLQGNPLAAITTGLLLREHLTVDHWSDILRKESWKSLGLSGGIMPALKLSYDELPYRLQQCFSYCSIFPNKYRFLGKDLVYIWISQGFLNCTQNKRLEDTGWEYLNHLVNLGFFQQIEEQQELDEEEEFSLPRQIWYSMCDLMHDFARMVSRTECATIDGLQCNKILPTVHHLSIVTGSAYHKDLYGNIPRNEKFEENLRNSVTSVTKLRTLVVLGKFDSFFVRLFQDIFQKAQNLRLLRVSSESTYMFPVPAASTDFNSFLCSLANPLHLRYLKLKFYGFVPQVLSAFFHLQVLDVGSNMDASLPDGLHNLVSLRHLVAHKILHSSIASIGNMTSIQELEVQISSGFEITQLKSMNELVQLGVSHLDSVKTREEAYEAGLRNKEHLEELHLSWNDTFSENESVSDTRSESSVNMAREVIEGLEPHMDLKHLHISGYNGIASPTWLAKNISVTSLQTLHLDDCGGWKILPSLESLPLLTRLTLRSMREVIQVIVPSLQELVLVEMPKLERCSCSSVGGMSSSLRELQIKDCQALKEFDLFENNNNFEIKQRSWLPSLRKLILCDCPQLEVLKPLPPSTCSEFLISGVSMLPTMEGSSSGNLYIGYLDDDIDEYSDLLRILDESFLAFHNLGNLKSMMICGQTNLRSFLFEGFSHLISLKSLEIKECEKLFSSDVTQPTLEGVTAFPSLESLTIKKCGIAGKQLSVMLQHAPNLEELDLDSLEVLTEDSSSGDPDDAWSARKEDFYIPLKLASSLKKITMTSCPYLTFINWSWSGGGFSGFAFLEKLTIWDCPDLLSSLVHKDGSDDGTNGRWLLPPSLEELDIREYDFHGTLQPCFPRDSTSLKKLVVWRGRDLHTIQLHSCTALEKLEIQWCGSLTALEGLQFLGRLMHLNVSGCPGLVHEDGNDDQANGRWLLPTSLRQLKISVCHCHETLKPCFPTDSTNLESLEVQTCRGLQSIQLDSCTALEELTIGDCGSLTALEGLQCLGRLTHLNIEACPGLANGRWLLPTSLRKLEIWNSDSHETLQPCFPTDSTSLESLVVWSSPRLQSIQLHSCTALEELKIGLCGSLTALEGLQCLGRLKHLYVSYCPGLPPFLESFSRPDYGLCPRLERLEIHDPSVLTTSFCKHLTSLQSLELRHLVQVRSLTDEQEQALVLLKSLKELRFFFSSALVDLPARLRDLPSLQRLKINLCMGISRLPVTGLPLSLEELEIYACSKELADECRLLPPSKLDVKIDCCV